MWVVVKDIVLKLNLYFQETYHGDGCWRNAFACLIWEWIRCANSIIVADDIFLAMIFFFSFLAKARISSAKYVVVRVSNAGAGVRWAVVHPLCSAFQGAPRWSCGCRGSGGTSALSASARQRKAIAVLGAAVRKILSVQNPVRFLGGVNEGKNENEGWMLILKRFLNEVIIVVTAAGVNLVVCWAARF